MVSGLGLGQGFGCSKGWWLGVRVEGVWRRVPPVFLASFLPPFRIVPFFLLFWRPETRNIPNKNQKKLLQNDEFALCSAALKLSVASSSRRFEKSPHRRELIDITKTTRVSKNSLGISRTFGPARRQRRRSRPRPAKPAAGRMSRRVSGLTMILLSSFAVYT